MQQILRLLEIMRLMRDPVSGCPWDRAQTLQSLRRYTVEEAYEVVDAIDRADAVHHRDELGDLLFQIVFQSRIAEELGQFDFHDVAQAISDKMVRRHPHVFARDQTAEASDRNWEKHKEQERLQSGNPDRSLMAGVVRGQPALMRAHGLQKRAARCGFDWTSREGVLDKVEEEFREFREALDEDEQAHRHEEFGDLLFAMVNLARHTGIQPEEALRDACEKFERRFRAVESAVAASSARMEDCSEEQLDREWRAVKAAERQQS